MLIEKIGTCAMLEQTAEECAELAQACLKLARYYRGINMPAKEYNELVDNLEEEVADVTLCLEELEGSEYHHVNVDKWIDMKYKRIKERFDDRVGCSPAAGDKGGIKA